MTVAGTRRGFSTLAAVFVVSLCAAAMTAGTSAARPLPGELWAPAVEVAGVRQGTEFAHLVAYGHGHVTAAWMQARDRGGDGARLMFAQRLGPGAGWSVPELIDTDGVGPLDVSADHDGNLTLLYYHRVSGGNGNMLYAMQSPAGQVPTSPTRISMTAPSRLIRDAELEILPDGTAVVVWREQTGPGSRRVAWVHRDGIDAVWSQPEYLTPANSVARSIELDATPDGTATLVWLSQRRSAGRQPIYSRLLPAGSDTWATTETVYRGTVALRQPAVRSGPAGRVMVTMVSGHRHQSYYSSVRSPNGTWTDPVRIDSTAYSTERDSSLGEPLVTFVPGDRAEAWSVVAVWVFYRYFPFDAQLRTATYRHGQWSEAHDIASRPGRSEMRLFSVETYPSGSVRATWMFQPLPRPDRSCQDRCTRFQVQTVVRSTAGVWSATANATNDQVVNSTRPQLALLPGRSASVLFGEPSLRLGYAEVLRPQ